MIHSFSSSSISIQSFQNRFDKVLQKFIISKATPIKPNKKKPKGRIEKMDSLGMFEHERRISLGLLNSTLQSFTFTDDSFSSTNSGHSRTAVDSSATTTNETITDDSTLLRPVRTGRAKQPPCYVSLSNKFMIKWERYSTIDSSHFTERASFEYENAP